MFELPDVAGPAVRSQRVEDARRYSSDGLARLRGELLEERVHEERNVLGALPERRKDDRDDVQAVVEILPERSRPGGRLQVPVRRGDDPHVRRERPRSTNTLELPVLKDAQELGLNGRTDVPDLVQEDRAPVGHFETPFPVRHGSGESAPFVAEQFAVEEGFGERRAVDLDERLVGARRVEVDRARHELLARPALAQEEDRAPGPRYVLDRPVDLLHLLVAADDPVEAGPLFQGALELAVLVGQALLLGGDQAVETERLANALRDDLEETEVFLHARLRPRRTVGGEHPNHFALDADGDGNESHGSLLREPEMRPRPPEEERIVPDIARHIRNARFHHLSDHAFAHLVSSTGLFFLGQTVGLVDGKLVRFGIV